MASSNQVAVVGYAQSQVQRHADSSLGALTTETARAAIDRADGGGILLQVGEFVAGTDALRRRCLAQSMHRATS